jgi:hypothetical protein
MIGISSEMILEIVDWDTWKVSGLFVFGGVGVIGGGGVCGV